jgi:hypothetical protein
MLLPGEPGSQEVAMIANVRRFLAAVPAVTLALLSHAGVCPAWWPLVGGLMSSVGTTFLVETRYLLPLMIGCLALALAALAYGGRRNYGPFVLGIVASALILIGRFTISAAPVTVGGVCLLVGAHFWGFWLRRPSKASPCQRCYSPTATTTVEEGTSPRTGTNTDIPIACALNQTQFAERKQLVDRLAQEATARHRLPNGVSLCFEAISGRITELAKFVDLEKACCPFLTFRIDAQAGGPVWLVLTGPVAAQEFIQELIPEIVSHAESL